MEMTIVRDGAKPFLRHGTHRVRGYTNRNASRAERLDASKVGVKRDIAEAALFFLWRRVETALRVGGHEQYDTDACFAPSLQDGLGHGIGVSIGLAAGLVVDVVELAYAGVASSQHLTIGLRC